MTWQTARLGDLCHIQSGGTPSRTLASAYGGDIPWAKIADLEAADSIVNRTEEMITLEGLKAIGNRLFPAGTLLLAMYGSVGKTATAGVDLSTNQAILGIQIERHDVLDEAFLRWWLSSYKRQLFALARGVTQKNISATIVRDLEIPLPTLLEQRRIATLLAKADVTRRKRHETMRLIGDFLRAVFLDMFGDPMANPKGWPTGIISDLAASTQYGTSKKAAGVGEFPYLRMGNITYEGGWDFSDMKFIDLTEDEQARYLVHRGDVLFNRTNSRDLVGKTAVFREPEPMAYAGYLVKLVANEHSDGEYIAAAMNTASMKAYLRAKCKNIIGMANINAREFQNIPVPLPPVRLQKRYAQIVHRALEARKRLACSASEMETLFSALSQNAFSGELLTPSSAASGQRISFRLPAEDRLASKDPSVYLMQFVLLLLQTANEPVRLVDIARAYALLNRRGRIEELAIGSPNRAVVDEWSNSYAEIVDEGLFGTAIHDMAMKRKEIVFQGEGQDVTVATTQFAAIPKPVSPWRRLDAQIAYWAVSNMPQIVFEEDSIASVVIQMTQAAIAA